MDLNNFGCKWKYEVQNLGIVVDNADLLECIEETMNEDNYGVEEIMDSVKSDTYFTISNDKISNFFYDIFNNEELANNFTINFSLYVDLTYEGKLSLPQNDYFENITDELAEIGLIELLGEEKAKGIIITNVFKKAEVKEKLDQEIYKRLYDFAKPLGKQLVKKLEELEEALRNEIKQRNVLIGTSE